VWLSSNNAGVTNPSASASRAGWYGEGGHDCCEAYQKDESSKVRELASESRLRASTCTLHPSQVAICGARTQADCAAAPKIRIDRAWLEFQLRNILAFRAAHDVPVWIVRTPPFKQPRPQLCAYDVPAHGPLPPHTPPPHPPTPTAVLGRTSSEYTRPRSEGRLSSSATSTRCSGSSRPRGSTGPTGYGGVPLPSTRTPSWWSLPATSAAAGIAAASRSCASRPRARHTNSTSLCSPH